MSIRVRCPGCNTEYALADQLAGKKVRCKKCQGVIAVEAATEDDARPPAAVLAEPPRWEKERSLPVKQSDRPTRRRDEDDADALPIKKNGGVALWLILGGVGAALLLVLACGGVGLWFTFGLLASTSPNSSPVAVVSATSVVDDAPVPLADPAPFHLADVRRSVVLVRCIIPGVGPRSGSGFLVSKDGLVATNRHVIQPEGALLPASQLMVGVASAADPDQLDYFKAEVAYSAPEPHRDLALLKIAARPGYPAFRPLPLAVQPALGDSVAVLGYSGGAGDPHRASLFFNKGGLCSTGVEINSMRYYETEAVVNRGNAGGPLINTDGAVLGIVTMARTGATNTTLALPHREIGLAGALTDAKLAQVQPQPGPVDALVVPMPTLTIPHRKASWDVAQGKMQEEEHSLIVTTIGAGSAFWVTSKDSLPENFQLNFSCLVPSVQGNDRFVQKDRHLYLRFDTDETDKAIDAGGGPGTTVVFTPTMLSIWNRERSAVKRMSIPLRPFLLTITRQGGDVTVAVDGNVALQTHLNLPSSGSHKVSIGSRISYPLCFGDIAIDSMDPGAAEPGRDHPPRVK